MDEAHKELVKRLKRTVFRSDWDDTIVYANPDGVDAADALEALVGEVATLTEKNGALAEDLARWKREVTVAYCVRDTAAAERDRLKVALEPFNRAAVRLERIQYLTGTDDEVPIGMGIMPEHLKAARKALGDAS